MVNIKKTKHIRSQSERGLLCITVSLLLAKCRRVVITQCRAARTNRSKTGDVAHSIVVHSNMIAIMLYRFESAVRLLKRLSKHGIRHAPDRGVTSMQVLAKLRKLVRWIQCHVCECDDVTNRDVARFRCVDVNAVLQAESFANVSSLSNIVAQHISIAI